MGFGILEIIIAIVLFSTGIYIFFKFIDGLSWLFSWAKRHIKIIHAQIDYVRLKILISTIWVIFCVWYWADQYHASFRRIDESILILSVPLLILWSVNLYKWIIRKPAI